MTTHNVSSLAMKRFVPPDGNHYNPDRIQTSGGSRTTEDEALLLLVYGCPIPAPYGNTATMNGQIVDVKTMLMCSRCCHWKRDKEFARDRTRIIRRGRRYYCSDCHKHMRH